MCPVPSRTKKHKVRRIVAGVQRLRLLKGMGAPLIRTNVCWLKFDVANVDRAAEVRCGSFGLAAATLHYGAQPFDSKSEF